MSLKNKITTMANDAVGYAVEKAIEKALLEAFPEATAIGTPVPLFCITIVGCIERGATSTEPRYATCQSNSAERAVSQSKWYKKEEIQPEDTPFEAFMKMGHTTVFMLCEESEDILNVFQEVETEDGRIFRLEMHDMERLWSDGITRVSTLEQIGVEFTPRYLPY